MRRLTMNILMAVTLLSVHGILDHVAADHIPWDLIAAGATLESNSSEYRVSASVGQVGVVLLVGSTYHIYSGFWNTGLFENVGIEDRRGFELPSRYELDQNYPNPFGSTTSVPYALPKSSHVSVEIYNLHGQRVRQIVQGVQEAGYYIVNWDGKSDVGWRVGSGIYVCRMVARPSDDHAFIKIRKMVVIH